MRSFSRASAIASASRRTCAARCAPSTRRRSHRRAASPLRRPGARAGRACGRPRRARRRPPRAPLRRLGLPSRWRGCAHAGQRRSGPAAIRCRFRARALGPGGANAWWNLRWRRRSLVQLAPVAALDLRRHEVLVEVVAPSRGAQPARRSDPRAEPCCKPKGARMRWGSRQATPVLVPYAARVPRGRLFEEMRTSAGSPPARALSARERPGSRDASTSGPSPFRPSRQGADPAAADLGRGPARRDGSDLGGLTRSATPRCSEPADRDPERPSGRQQACVVAGELDRLPVAPQEVHGRQV